MNVARPLALLVGVLLLVWSCVDGEGPLAPGSLPLPSASFALQASLVSSPADAAARPVNRIRAFAERVPDGEVVASTVTDVSPTGDSWEIVLEVPTAPGLQVVVSLQLIHVDASGHESVEFSGRTDVVAVSAAGPSSGPLSVRLVRGPRDNLAVTSVSISSAPQTLQEGDSAALSASVTTDVPGAQPTVYWSMLDEGIGRLEGSTVHALLPGVLRVAATAGAHSDTVVIAVTQRPDSVSVAPDSLAVVGPGSDGTFVARVLDRRGDTIPGAAVLWRSLAPDVVEATGDGRFRALKVGRAQVEALAAADTTLRARAVFDVLPVPTDLALTKSAARATVEPGDTVTFTLTVTNLGPSPVEGVQVVDDLPAGLSLVDASAGSGTFDAGVWNVGTMAAGADASLRLLARTGAGEGGRTLVNVASVTHEAGYRDTDASNDQATASVSVLSPRADLAVQKSVDQAVVAAGLDVTFTVTVTNPGPHAPESVLVRDVLPAGLALKSSTTTAGTYEPKTGEWALDLPVNASATLEVVATAEEGAVGGTLVNAAEIASAPGIVDPNGDNDRAEASVQVVGAATRADVRVSKWVDMQNPAEGDTVVFTLVVANAGPDTATQVVVFDSLPEGLDSVSVVLPTGAVALERGLAGLAPLAPGDSAVGQVTAAVATGTVGDTLWSELRVVSLDQEDPDTLNNASAVSLIVLAPPTDVDIAVLGQVTPSTVRETGAVTFTVRAANLGATDATGLVLRDSLSAAFSLDSAAASVGAWAEDTGLWTIGVLAAGDSAKLVLHAVTADGTGGTTQPNTAAVVSLDQPDPVSANDSSTVRLVVEKRTLDLSIAETIDVASPLEGTKVRYTVTLRNHGPGSATSIQVLDSMPLVMAFDTAEASVGTVDAGGNSWTVPSLAAGDSATLSTYHTVGLGAAGTTVTSRVRIASLAQADTVATNDTASVVVEVPTSTPPVVAISSPADGASFDPGDTVAFAASAGDQEDGDLTASIVWTSSRNGTIGTGASLTSHTLSAGPHTIAARVTDSSGTVAADTVKIILAIVGAPTSLNVPFGGTASLPISLSAPAPEGGLVLTVSSSAPATAEPTATTVTIPGGMLSANATIQGLEPGTATITVASVGYGSATTVVSVKAALNVVQSSLTFPQTRTGDITVRLESSGSVIAAPAGGLDVTLTSAIAGCVAAPSSVTIPGGQTQTTVTLSHGGAVDPPCTTYVKATATSVVADSVRVRVDPPPVLTVNGYSWGLGSGLQQASSVYLGTAAPAGGVTVRVESADPSALLIAPDVSTPGSAWVDFVVPAGGSYVSYYAQGVEEVADATVVVSATASGYTAGSTSWVVKQPALSVSGVNANTTTLSADDPFTVVVGVPYGTYVTGQSIRAGGTGVTARITSSTPSVGLLTTLEGNADTASVKIPVGSSSSASSVAGGGVAVDPVGSGSTTISATIPGFTSQPDASRTVNVSAPALTVNGYSWGLGSGLQQSASVYLGTAAPAGGVTVRVESVDPSALLIAPDASTPGSAYVDFTVPAGGSYVTYYAQGVEEVTDQTVLVTATAPAYTADSTSWVVKQPALSVSGVNANTTTLSADDPFTVVVGVPYGTYVTGQSIRAGGTEVTARIASSTPSVGLLTTREGSGDTASVTIPVGSSSSPYAVDGGGVAVDPVGSGSTTISATIPGFTSQPDASRTVNVSAPALTVNGYSWGLGSGLQQSASVYLGTAAPAGGVTVRVESADPSALLIAPDASTAGSAYVDFAVPAGGSYVTYFAQGVEGVADRTVVVSATAPAYTAASTSWVVKQPALSVSGLTTSTNTFAGDDPFTVVVGVPYGTSVASQSIRAGGEAVTATIASSVPSVGQFTTGLGSSGSASVTIPVGLSSSPSTVGSGGVAFDALSAGSTVVSATIPGFYATTDASRAVTVTAPGITVSSGTVGGGLQRSASVTLGSGGHGGVTLRIQSSAPGVLLVSPDASTAGEPYIEVAVPAGAQTVSYYVQGLEETTGTGTITASAAGFTDGSAAWAVETPRVAIYGLNTTTTAAAADDPFEVRIGLAYGNGVTVQAVRAGGSDVTATVVSSTPAAGRLAVTAGAFPSVTLTIPVGSWGTPTYVANSGVAFDPVAAGSTTVSATVPGFIAQPDATRGVTINP